MGNFIKLLAAILVFIVSSHLQPVLAAASNSIENGAIYYYNKNYVAALRQWAPLAQNGNVKAQHNIGVLYFKGLGVKKNLKSARGWFMRAAKAGFARSQHNLGWIYEMGLGVKLDLKQANYWYRLAAKQNFGPSENRIGFLLYNNKSYAPALRYLNRAARRGQAQAQFLLGEIYIQGLGVEKNLGRAVRWYKTATNHGNAKAAYALAQYYLKKNDPRLNLQILNLLNQSAETGNIEAVNGLGWLFAKGIGVRRDNDKAIKIFKISAAGGYTESALNIVTIYSDRSDEKNAYLWLLIAESLGVNDLSAKIKLFEEELNSAERTEAQKTARKWFAETDKDKGHN